MWCATRPPWSATAWTRRTCPAMPSTMTPARRGCSRRCRGLACATWCSLRRWWSTVTAATPARSTATCHRPYVARTISPPAGSIRAARSAVARSRGGRSARTRRSCRAPAMPRPRSRRSTTPAPGARSTTRGRSRCAITTSTARACPRTRRTPVWRRSSARRSRAARRRRCSRTVGRCGTSCTSVTSRAPTCWRLSRSRRTASGLTPYNVASGHPFTIGEMAATLSAAAGGAPPELTGDYRRFDVRHVVASPKAAAAGLGFVAEITPEVGLAQLATDPLRPRESLGGG